MEFTILAGSGSETDRRILKQVRRFRTDPPSFQETFRQKGTGGGEESCFVTPLRRSGRLLETTT